MMIEFEDDVGNTYIVDTQNIYIEGTFMGNYYINLLNTVEPDSERIS